MCSPQIQKRVVKNSRNFDTNFKDLAFRFVESASAAGWQREQCRSLFCNDLPRRIYTSGESNCCGACLVLPFVLAQCPIPVRSVILMDSGCAS